MAKEIKYSEPTAYFPKELRDEFFKNKKKSASKKSTTKSGTKTKKK